MATTWSLRNNASGPGEQRSSGNGRDGSYVVPVEPLGDVVPPVLGCVGRACRVRSEAVVQRHVEHTVTANVPTK